MSGARGTDLESQSLDVFGTNLTSGTCQKRDTRVTRRLCLRRPPQGHREAFAAIRISVFQLTFTSHPQLVPP
jgi:hypothetical protein